MGNKQSRNAGKKKKGQQDEGKQSNATKRVKMTPTMTKDDFKILNLIGQGSFAKVFMVEKKDTGKVYAMKVLKKQELVRRKQVDHTITERQLLQDVDHPFIVSLRFSFQTDTHLYMVLDFFTGGELFYHLKTGGRFGEERGKFYAAEIALALQCLHDNGYIYRDLKPENILLDREGHIKLTDFGLSKSDLDGNELTHTFCGTPEYLAPEVIRGEGYSKVVDWWSLGTLLYEMIGGLPPYYSTNVNVMYEKILKGKLTFNSSFSQEAQDLLSGMLQRKPSKRLGQNGMTDFYDHPFFASIDWEKLYEKQLQPPFLPKSTGEDTDVQNVDPEFKNSNRVEPETPATHKATGDVLNFDKFTFAPADGAAEGMVTDTNAFD